MFEKWYGKLYIFTVDIDDILCIIQWLATYIHMHMYIYIWTYIHIFIYTYTHIYIYTCLHAYMHTYLDIYIYTYKYIYMLSSFLKYVFVFYYVWIILEYLTLVYEISNFKHIPPQKCRPWKFPCHSKVGTSSSYIPLESKYIACASPKKRGWWVFSWLVNLPSLT